MKFIGKVFGKSKVYSDSKIFNNNTQIGNDIKIAKYLQNREEQGK